MTWLAGNWPWLLGLFFLLSLLVSQYVYRHECPHCGSRRIRARTGYEPYLYCNACRHWFLFQERP